MVNIKVIIGVDIGLKGAIASLTPFYKTNCGITRLALVWDMPTRKVKIVRKRKKPRIVTQYDINRIRDIFIEIINTYPDHEIVCFIEEAQIIPRGFTIKSNTGLARCQGTFEGILSALRINYELIDPKDWQPYFEIFRKKGNTGEQSIKTASKMFPTIEFSTPRGRILDGRADALLIAEYGKLTHENKSWSNI